MKAKKKVLITDITSAIESTLDPAAEQPKKVIKAVEKTAKKLANKLVKVSKKEKNDGSVKTGKSSKDKTQKKGKV